MIRNLVGLAAAVIDRMFVLSDERAAARRAQWRRWPGSGRRRSFGTSAAVHGAADLGQRPRGIRFPAAARSCLGPAATGLRGDDRPLAGVRVQRHAHGHHRHHRHRFVGVPSVTRAMATTATTTAPATMSTSRGRPAASTGGTAIRTASDYGYGQDRLLSARLFPSMPAISASRSAHRRAVPGRCRASAAGSGCCCRAAPGPARSIRARGPRRRSARTGPWGYRAGSR